MAEMQSHTKGKYFPELHSKSVRIPGFLDWLLQNDRLRSVSDLEKVQVAQGVRRDHQIAALRHVGERPGAGVVDDVLHVAGAGRVANEIEMQRRGGGGQSEGALDG